MPHLAVFALPALAAACICRASRPRAYGTVLGILIAAAVYLGVLIGGGEPQRLIGMLGIVLHDPLHQAGILSSVKTAAAGVRQNIPFPVFLQSGIGCILVALARKHRISRCCTVQTIYVLLGIAQIGVTAMKSVASICFLISVPMTVLTLPLALEALLAGSRHFALALYAEGLLIAAAFCVGSNTGLDAMTVGFTCSCAGGILLMFPRGKQADRREKADAVRAVLAFCLCMIVLGTYAAHRFLGIYRDAPVSALVQKLEDGPAAGLYTTQEHAAEYEAIISEINAIRLRCPDAGSVLFSKRIPWAYLVTDWRVADMTAWTTAINDPRLMEYYAEHPQPDLVMILAEDTTGFETAPFNNHTGSREMNGNSLKGPFYDYLLNNYELMDKTPQMTVYCLR